MTITRSLLSKLHLPYKQLGIEGSKGDQLYLPDDVGVNLSLSHGLSGSDMIPNTTDKYGNAKVTGTSFLPIPSINDAVPLVPEITVVTSETFGPFDIDGYNYVLLLFSARNLSDAGDHPNFQPYYTGVYNTQPNNFSGIDVFEGLTQIIPVGFNPVGWPALSPIIIRVLFVTPGDSADIRIDMITG